MSFNSKLFTQAVYCMVKMHCWETYLVDEWKSRIAKSLLAGKEPVKLMQRVKIAHSFLQFVSHQFYVIILSLPTCLCSSKYRCQRIFLNPLLKMEKRVVLIRLYL